jgi:carbon storage regulator
MLVLSRKHNESIMIGDDVRVTVIDIRNDKIRLGVSAPRSIEVHRQEVYDTIKEANRKLQEAATEDEQEAGTDTALVKDDLSHNFRVIGLPRPGVLLKYADTLEQAYEYAEKLDGEVQEYIYGIGWVFRLTRKREEACK